MSFYTFGVDLVMTSMLEMLSEHVNGAFIFIYLLYQQRWRWYVTHHVC